MANVKKNQNMWFHYPKEEDLTAIWVDKSIPVWVRIVNYMTIMNIGYKKELKQSNKYLARRFNCSISNVKYAMFVINKKLELATFKTRCNQNLKGKTRRIELNVPKIKTLMQYFGIVKYEILKCIRLVKFQKNRIISWFSTKQRKTKYNVCKRDIAEYVKYQLYNTPVGKHLQGYNKKEPEEEDSIETKDPILIKNTERIVQKKKFSSFTKTEKTPEWFEDYINEFK